MISRIVLTALTVLVSTYSNAATVSVRLYLNTGLYTAVDSAEFPMSAFNLTPAFVPQNAHIVLSPNDSLNLTVINTDSILHGFRIKGHTSTEQIAPSDSINTIVVFNENHYATIYYDPLGDSSFRASGLAGMIHVSNKEDHLFYWNIKEYQKDWAQDLTIGQSVDWNTYYPDYFTINGRSNPQINQDTIARVQGGVGDEIQIIIANTGSASHSIHFHGYHAEIIFSSANSMHVGRSKDTFPIKPMETMILEIIPDKPGEYPVHDHNLSAVSAGGIYPNGMFLTMKIE